jgi:hypothetical protein
MSVPGWKKALVTSVLLAAAGVLACVAALFDVWVPQGSLLAFVIALPFLALATIGIMVGFIKVCEKGEDLLQSRRDRLWGGKNEGQERAGVPTDPHRRSPRAAWPSSWESSQPADRDTTRYVSSLRGLPAKSSNGDAPKPFADEAISKYKVWHGQ